MNLQATIDTNMLTESGLVFVMSQLTRDGFKFVLNTRDDGTSELVVYYEVLSCWYVEESLPEECQYYADFDMLAKERYCIGLDDITDHEALYGCMAEGLSADEALEYYAAKRDLVSFDDYVQMN